MEEFGKTVTIIIATHKIYQMPKDGIYLPLQVGAKGKKPLKNFIGDDSGKNISDKNPSFCELTGLYWAWKNLKSDYIGLAHYRRHFSVKKRGYCKNLEDVLSGNECAELLKKSDIILPKKRHYFIETLYSHYAHTLYPEPLDKTREIIVEKYPDYLPAFDRLKKRRSGHMFNMFVMSKKNLDGYCSWLFDILFELEKQETKSNKTQTDASATASNFHARFYGRISELLLDVYLETNNLSYVETNFVYTEKIHYFAKVKSFLSAKLFDKKYEGSF